MYECSRGLGTMLEHFIVVGSDDFHFIRLYLRIVKGSAPLGPKLENSEMPDIFGHFLDCLHSRSPGANHRHPLVCEIYRGMRPSSGVKGLSLERFDTLDFRQNGLGEDANSRNQESALVGIPIP